MERLNEQKKSDYPFRGGLAVLLAGIMLFSGNSDTSARDAGDRAGSGSSFTQDEGSSGGLNLLDWLFSALGKKDGGDDPTKGADDPRYVKLIEGIDRLYENFGMLSKDKQDEKKLLLDQSALIIDYRLGPDHPKKKEFLEIVGWSHDQRQPINKKFMDGQLTQKELFEQLDTHFKDVTEKYASIFTDEEYRRCSTWIRTETWRRPWDLLRKTPRRWRSGTKRRLRTISPRLITPFPKRKP